MPKITLIYYVKKLLLVCSLFYIQACGSEKEASAFIDPFVEEIKKTMPKQQIISQDTVSGSEAEPTWITVTPDNEYLVVADRQTYAIQLFNKTGTKEFSKVGGKGRGPGEFISISDLHAGQDMAVYVVDLKLSRITKFNIGNESLSYVTTYSVKPQQNLSLHEIYVTQYGKFGVFQRMDDYETWEQSYHLYHLDEKFQPLKHLLKMPGNEKMKLGQYSYIDALTGKKTFWDLDGKWFYHIRSDSPTVHLYNITTGEQRKKTFFTLKKSINTDHSTEILKNDFKAHVKRFPVITESIEEDDTIPMFGDFLVRNKQIFFEVYPIGNKEYTVIRVDQETGNTSYFTIPWLARFFPAQNILYSIQYNNNQRRQTMNIIKLQ
mgnify:CR=1 FL=1